MRRLAVPLLLTASMVALGIAWLMATPVGSAPDEGAHYVKAIGAGGGDLRGRPPTLTERQRQEFFRQGATGDRRIQGLVRAARTPAARWQARTRRQFRVPRRLVASGFGCTAFSRETTGACTETRQPAPTTDEVPTYVGTYQPYLYVPVGAVMRLASDSHGAMRGGRAATLFICASLLAAALWLLWDPRGPLTSLLGWLLAVSPMVVFVSTVLSPSGPEVAGAVCLVAALLRLTREEPPPRWLWPALAVAGTVLACSRALGPAFVIVLFAAVALLTGPRELWGRIRAGGRWAVVALAAVALAGLAGGIWEFAVQPRPEPSGSGLLDAVGPSLAHLPTMGVQAIGVFGAADASMPWAGYALWLLVLLAVGGAAVAVGGRRERASVLGLVVGTLVVVIGMSLVYREIGRLQGRYALPVLVLLPLWLGEVVHRCRARLSLRAARALAGVSFGGVALVQGLGWLSSAHRFAVGESGPWTFLGGADWSPPSGWAPWAILAAGGAAMCAAAGAVAVFRRDLD